MKTLMHRRPRDLELWRGRHLQLASISLTAPLAQMHMNLAEFYREQIEAALCEPA